MADTTQNTLVQINQGGSALTIASGGSLTADSGSTTTLSGSVTITDATVTTSTVSTLNLTIGKFSVGTATAAAGSASTDAGALPTGSIVYPTSAADDAKGVKINASDNVTGRIICIGNKVSNKALLIYPPAGGTINGAAANAAYTSGSGRGVIVICEDATANTAKGAFLAFG